MTTNVLKAVVTPIKLIDASTDIIKAVQQCLNITVDGVVGKNTIAAFYDFKKKSYLDSPDYLGVSTVEKLLQYQPKNLISKTQAETIFKKTITELQLKDLNSCLQKFNIVTPARIRHFISQLAHESGNLKWLKEIASGCAYENRKDLGNNCPGDGSKYKGAGAIQLTGKFNYQALCNYLNDSKIMDGCDYVALVYPFTSAGYWWMKNNMNQIIDNGATVEQVTRRVNGGINGLQDRIHYYKIACTVIV